MESEESFGGADEVHRDTRRDEKRACVMERGREEVALEVDALLAVLCVLP